MYEVNGIVYAGSPMENIKISSASITGDMMMLVTFSTGEQRIFDATVLTGEVFDPLKNNAIFQNFHIVHGTLTWMNEQIDIAPEFVYEKSFSYQKKLA